MSSRQRRSGVLLALAALGALASASCDSNSAPPAGDNKVFFVGYLYDGATGARLGKDAGAMVSIVYGDKTIKVDIEDDGRFVSKDPLPTWQDFAVTIAVDGYRAFTSHNLGIDVPASLAMTNGVASASTTQTFAVDAYLFPTSLKAPALTLTVATVDDMTGLPVLNKAAGTLRLRPQTASGVQVGAADGTTATPRASRRVWTNDEDLLTQTITKPIAAGTVTVAAGDMVYGVQYELSIYDVAGYQPLVASGAQGIVAGTVTSKTITLTRDARDPLRLIATDAAMCTTPASTATTYGAAIHLTFSEKIELVGTTYAEDIDNGVSVVVPSAVYPAVNCPLKTSTDPTMVERGTKVEVADAVLTLSFNPSMGFAATYLGSVCMAPSSITTVTYGNLSLIIVQPVGDPTRKRSLSTMLQELQPSQLSASISCPSRATF